MKPAAHTAATLACALAGWWLPALWETETPRAAVSILPPPRAEKAATTASSLDAAVRRAGSAMAQFQAVVASVSGHGASLTILTEGFSGLTCEEAETLAAQLAGEEFARTAGEDGPAFLRSLKGLDSTIAQAAFSAWAEARPETALRAICSPEGSDFQYSGILETLVRRDPAKALALLRAAPDNGTMSWVWQKVLAAHAEQNPTAALAALQSAPISQHRESLSAMLGAIAGKDPQAAFAWLAALPPELRVVAEVRPIYQAWARTDPAAVAAHWLQTDPAGVRLNVNEFAFSWVEKDPEAALAWFQKNLPDIPAIGVPLYLGGIAKTDPQRAAALFNQLAGENRPSADSIAQNWPGTGFSDAIQWAAGLSNEVEREGALNVLLERAPPMPEAERRALIAAAGPESKVGFRSLLEFDQSQALQTFTTQPLERRLELWQALHESGNTPSPEAAAPLLSNMLAASPGGLLTGAAATITTRWAQHDPGAAAAWVETLPPGEPQQWAAANLATNWGRHDPGAAAAWIERLPAGPAKSLAQKQFAELTGGKP